MGTFLHEIRFAVRNLRKSPGTTALAVVVLALGIGGNSAMFNLTSALLFRPPSFPESERVLSVVSRDQESGRYRGFSYPNYADLREASTSFENLAVHDLSMVGIEENGETRRSFIALVSGNYFATFRVQPFRGRFLRPDEEATDTRVAVMSYKSYERRGRPQDVVGSSVVLNGTSYTVVGVAPEGFNGTMMLVSPELWVPLDSVAALGNAFDHARERGLFDRDNHALVVFGRLRDGVDESAAQADVERVAAALAASYPEDNEGQTFSVHPLSRLSVSTSPQDDSELNIVGVLLMSMATVLLLVAGLNLATLEGARALARRREIALRFALGSGRWTVIRQLLAESLVVSLLAGALGLAAAWAVPRLLVSSMQRLVPLQLTLPSDIDWRVLSATIGFCVLASLFVGLVPALRASRPDLVRDLAARVEGGRRRGRLLGRGDLPVLFEVALSMVLLVAAGLFLKGAVSAANIDPGFELARQAIVEIDTSLVGYNEEHGRQVLHAVETRLASLPGVTSVGSAGSIPFGMVSLGRAVAPLDAGDQPDEESRIGVGYNVAGAGYFTSMGIPVLRGRTFRPGEDGPVAVVDATLAGRLWPEGEALGRHFQVLSDDSGRFADLEVVGVVAPILESLFDSADESRFWLPIDRDFLANSHLHLRFDHEPDAALLAQVRDAVREVDPRLPVLNVRTMNEHMAANLEVWLLSTGGRLFAIFAGAALLLTLAGVYGVRAHSTASRSREIGIRMALGSSVGETLRLLLGEGLRLSLLGAGLGLLLALGVGRLLAGLLYSVSPADPVVFAISLAVLVAVATVACLVPARRAARVDPLVALRTE